MRNDRRCVSNKFTLIVEFKNYHMVRLDMTNKNVVCYAMLISSFSWNLAYLSEHLSTNVSNPTEGEDITITCDLLQTNNGKHDAKWSKDSLPVKFTQRVYSVHKEKQHTLEIKQSNTYDSGEYSIDVDGRKRSLLLDVKRNNHLEFLSKWKIKYKTTLFKPWNWKSLKVLRFTKWHHSNVCKT